MSKISITVDHRTASFLLHRLLPSVPRFVLPHPACRLPALPICFPSAVRISSVCGPAAIPTDYVVVSNDNNSKIIMTAVLPYIMCSSFHGPSAYTPGTSRRHIPHAVRTPSPAHERSPEADVGGLATPPVYENEAASPSHRRPN